MGYFLNCCIFFCEDSFDLVWFRGVLRYVFTICSVCILLNILLYFFIGETRFGLVGLGMSICVYGLMNVMLSFIVFGDFLL